MSEPRSVRNTLNRMDGTTLADLDLVTYRRKPPPCTTSLLTRWISCLRVRDNLGFASTSNPKDHCPRSGWLCLWDSSFLIFSCISRIFTTLRIPTRRVVVILIQGLETVARRRHANEAKRETLFLERNGSLVGSM